MVNRIVGTKAGEAFTGGDGKDVILGKGGSDTLTAASFPDDPDKVGKDVLRGGAGSDVIDLDGLGGDQRGFGQKGADFIGLGPGADFGDGGNGNDLFRWSSGASLGPLDTQTDTLIGGNGNDFVNFNLSFVTDLTKIRLLNPQDGSPLQILANGLVVAELSEFEGIELQVPNGANTPGYQGFDGADILTLGIGKHKVFGKKGEDFVDHQLDATPDTINLGAGQDQVRISFGFLTTDLSINLKTGIVETEGNVIATYKKVETYNVFGTGSSNDTIIGGKGDESLSGGLGSDSIKGNGGDDVITVSTLAGDSSIVRGNKGIDTVILSTGRGLGEGESIDMTGTNGSKVKASVDGSRTVLATGVEKVQVAGSNGDDTLIGLKRGDVLDGGAGDDEISGKGGKDTIITGGGQDTVRGGGGQDTFVFGLGSEGTGNALNVKDFKAQDKLALTASAFTGIDFMPGDDAVLEAGDGLTAATGSGSAFVYDTATGRLFLDTDGAGGEDADLIARLKAGGSASELSVDQIEII